MNTSLNFLSDSVQIKFGVQNKADNVKQKVPFQFMVQNIGKSIQNPVKEKSSLTTTTKLSPFAFNQEAILQLEKKHLAEKPLLELDSSEIKLLYNNFEARKVKSLFCKIIASKYCKQQEDFLDLKMQLSQYYEDKFNCFNFDTLSPDDYILSKRTGAQVLYIIIFFYFHKEYFLFSFGLHQSEGFRCDRIKQVNR